jgi:hypothetical protein
VPGPGRAERTAWYRYCLKMILITNVATSTITKMLGSTTGREQRGCRLALGLHNFQTFNCTKCAHLTGWYFKAKSFLKGQSLGINKDSATRESMYKPPIMNG